MSDVDDTSHQMQGPATYDIPMPDMNDYKDLVLDPLTNKWIRKPTPSMEIKIDNIVLVVLLIGTAYIAFS
jgi:hypothetical protein